MRFGLTTTGKVLLGTMVLLYFAALTSQSGLLLSLVGMALGCFTVNLLAAWRSVANLELHAAPSAHLTEGQRAWTPWRVLNTGRRPAGLIEVDSRAGLLFRLAQLPPRQQTSVVPELVYGRRGVYPHDEVQVASAHPFGLLRVSRRLQIAGEVVVYPAVFSTDAPRAAAYDLMLGGKHRGHRHSVSGIHFAGVRPFQAGDALRQIHWRSSAKGQGLMVKTYDEELSGRVIVITDCGHNGREPALDNCLRAAASLVVAGLEAGHHVEWTDLSRSEPVRLTPFADGSEVLEALARVKLEPGCLTAERLGRALERIHAKGAVHLVLTDCNEAALAALRGLLQQGRLASLYLPEGAAAPETGVAVTHYNAEGFME